MGTTYTLDEADGLERNVQRIRTDDILMEAKYDGMNSPSQGKPAPRVDTRFYTEKVMEDMLEDEVRLKTGCDASFDSLGG